MRIFVAGGTGAIGRPLVRRPGRGGPRGHRLLPPRGQGRRAWVFPRVVPAVGDAFDDDAVQRAVRAAEPEVVVNQLTSLAQSANPVAVEAGLRATSRLRRDGVGARWPPRPVPPARAGSLPRASRSPTARAPGCAPSPTPCGRDAPGQIGKLAGSLATLESATLGDDATEGVVLRYGSFYGPGTYFAAGGLYTSMIAKRRCPFPVDGGGLFGFVHVDDAAAATVAALQGPPASSTSSTTCPAPASEWMLLVARLLGAKPPHRVPEAVARLGAGKFLAYLMCDQPAVSNRRARIELGWIPRYPDWHDGLGAALAVPRS